MELPLLSPRAEPLLDHMSRKNIHQSASPLIPDKSHQQELGSYFLVPAITEGTIPNLGDLFSPFLACLLLLRGSEKPSLNCKSGLIIPYATNSQNHAALPEVEKGWCDSPPTLWTRGRGYFRDGIVDSIDSGAPAMLGLASCHFPCLPLFSSAQPMLELFPGLDYSLAISCCKLQQDSAPLLTARQI